MGKSKKDFMNKQGRAARSQGMKQESKGKKCCHFVFFILSALVYLIFGAIYGSRYSNVDKINKDFAMPGTSTLPYDTCMANFAFGYVPDPSLSIADLATIQLNMMTFCDASITDSKGQTTGACDKGTGWTAAMGFNTVIMIIQAANLAFLSLGAWWWFPRMCGTMLNCCYSIIHLVAFAIALGVRFNALGVWCAANVSPIQYEGRIMGIPVFTDSATYKSDGNILAALGAVQVVFWFVQCFFCWLPLCCTPSSEGTVVVVQHQKKVEPQSSPKKEHKKKKDGSKGSSSSSD